MLVKTPTRKQVHRKSCNVVRQRDRSKEAPLLSSDSKIGKATAANTSILNPQKKKKKETRSLGCVREKTQSTKVSKRKYEDLSNFQSYSDSLGRSMHQIFDSSLLRVRPPLSDVKHSRRINRAHQGLFTKENIEDLVKQRQRYLQKSRAENNRLEEYLSMLQQSKNNIPKRKALIDQSRARLNESWREMCLLLNNKTTPSTGADIGDRLYSDHQALTSQQRKYLDQEKFKYLKFLGSCK